MQWFADHFMILFDILVFGILFPYFFINIFSFQLFLKGKSEKENKKLK